jgi:hypothetical protein
MGDRKYRCASIIAATHILFEQIAASCREGLSLPAKIEGAVRRNKNATAGITSNRHASTSAPGRRSGRTSALPYPPPGLKNDSSKTKTNQI